MENLKTLKYQIVLIKPKFFLLLVVSVAVMIKKYLKQQRKNFHFKEKKWKRF